MSDHEHHFAGQNTVEPIRAWRLNEVDVVAGANLEETIAWYMRTTGLSRDEAVDPDMVREMPLHALGWFESDDDGSRVQCTLADLITRHKGAFPCVLCSYYS